MLEDALDAMPAGFEIWDRDDRLLRCNRRVHDLYPGTADLLQPGVAFETVLQRTLALGMIPAARGQEIAWMTDRMAKRGKLGRPFIVDYGGRWLQIDERRTRGGGSGGGRARLGFGPGGQPGRRPDVAARPQAAVGSRAGGARPGAARPKGPR